jgi:CHASE2 domain-containing sensor protein
MIRTALEVVEVMLALALYFLPAIIADRRKRRDLLTLALFNACVGWTGIGWLIALSWALLPNPPANLAVEVTASRRTTRMRAFSRALVERIAQRSAREHPR